MYMFAYYNMVTILFHKELRNVLSKTMTSDVHLQHTCERDRCPLGLSKHHPVFQLL